MASSRKPRSGIQNRTTILLFINQIKQYPCIWDQTDDNHRNTKARQDAWLAIARRIGENVPLLRRKWRSLYTSYFKIKKEWENIQAQCKGTSCARPSWFAYNEMDFLGNSKKTRRPRGKTDKYLILDDAKIRASKECDVVEIVNPDEDAEEIEESYETKLESDYTEGTCEYTLTYDLNEALEEDSSATLYYEKRNANDETAEESEVPLEKRYLNEKRKSILLHELNEKLEKDVQQQAAKIQLQQMKIASLEKKFEDLKRKTTNFMTSPQGNYDKIVSDEDEATTGPDDTQVHSTHVPTSTISTVQSLSLRDVDDQCDPLCNVTETMNHESNYETFQLVTGSIKRLEGIIGSFAEQSNRRYSGFGEFMVRELNEMDETTSIRLIDEITSMLKREGHNYRKNQAKRGIVKLS